MRIAVRLVALAAVLMLVGGAGAQAQRRMPARKPAPKLKLQPANVKCPEELGTGVRTGAQYCFVLAGRDPAHGVVVTIPAHTGPATLLFELHNRHTYSEEEVKAGFQDRLRPGARVRVRERGAGGVELREEAAGHGDAEAPQVRGERLDVIASLLG